ncbi:MAG: S8 family peptidase [Fimbriimonadaceae bacterium]
MGKHCWWTAAGAVVLGLVGTAEAVVRIDRKILDLVSTSTAPTYVPNEVLVQFNDGVTAARASAIASQFRLREIERVRTAAMEYAGDPGFSVMWTDRPVMEVVAQLNNTPGVAFAEPNYIWRHQQFNDTHFVNGTLWGVYGVRSTPSNQFGSRAADQFLAPLSRPRPTIVAVIDTGVQTAHPDLIGNRWVNPFDPIDGIDNDGNGYVDDVFGWNFVSGNNAVFESATGDRHGTHVAGTIAATANNGIGVVGVSPTTRFISVKFLGSTGGSTLNAVRSIDYVTDLKRRHNLPIVATNNSWGGGSFSTALFNAITRAAAEDILFVAAAGNGGSDGVGDDNDITPHYPSSYPHDHVIAVASITSTGVRSNFSNFGLTSVDIGAPGSAIRSTIPTNAYGDLSGTSMATPHVTGAIALLASYAPNRGLDLKNHILQTAIPTPSLQGRVVSGGRLNIVLIPANRF